MGRLPELDENTLSAEQRKIYDDIKRVRGQVRQPFAVWLRNAELGAGTLKLQDLFAARVKHASYRPFSRGRVPLALDQLHRTCAVLEERLKEFAGAAQLTHSAYYSNPAVIEMVAEFIATGNACLRAGCCTPPCRRQSGLPPGGFGRGSSACTR